jgi:anti-sigma factor RsiW
MMAMNNRLRKRVPGEIEMLLPWHANGTLSARDSRVVDDALASDPDLARQYAAIRDEYAATMDFNERLGMPSVRAVQKLFAAIDADCRGVRLASC